MDIQEIQEKFEDLLLANPDFDESLLEKDEEGSYSDSDIQHMYSMFEAGTEVGEQWQAKAQAVPEWVSVEDRLPQKGEMVYGYAAKHNYTCPVVFNGKKFYNEGLADNSISHWHYLAKPVKAQDPANEH